jgi:hypothetical protein
VTRRSAVCMTVGIVSLLVIGCTSWPKPSISDTATRPSVPTAMRMPSLTFTPELIVVSPSAEEGQTVRFTVVYDNNAYDKTLRTAWGFACWVEAGEATMLFDTGGVRWGPVSSSRRWW